MTNHCESIPLSEGMLYGPVAPPELHTTKGAQWVMNSVDGDLHGYQLVMLNDQVMLDKQAGIIDEQFADTQTARLNKAIVRASATHWIPKTKVAQIRADRREQRQDAPVADLLDWVEAAEIEREALEEMAHLTFNGDEAIETLQAAEYAKHQHEYRRTAAELS